MRPLKALAATGSTPNRRMRSSAANRSCIPSPVSRPRLESARRRHQAARRWKVYVDAADGHILDTISLLKEQDGRGRIFDPNPVVTLNDTSLEDSSAIADAAYTEVTLRDLDGSGHLDGPFVSTRTTANRVKRTGLDFRFKRPDRAFKEVMVYFHIDRVQRYIQDLGFTNVLNKPIAVNVDGIPDDNSFYSPLTKSLTFGTGGVDDAEDARSSCTSTVTPAGRLCPGSAAAASAAPWVRHSANLAASFSPR
jgi:hypothetical protein